VVFCKAVVTLQTRFILLVNKFDYYTFTNKTTTMGTKRPNNSVVLAQEAKRSKSDLVAYTNRDKALLESVSVLARRSTLSSP